MPDTTIDDPRAEIPQTWDELEASGLTWDDLGASDLTWDDLAGEDD